MALKVIVEPVVEPVSIEDAKAHLRIDSGFTEDDGYVSALVASARRFAENFTGALFVQRTCQLTVDYFPVSRTEALILPTGPAQSISSVTYKDEDGVQQIWDSGAYILDDDVKVPRILPAYDQAWPLARCETNAVTVEFIAGYAPVGGVIDDAAYRAGVPSDIGHAIKMLIGHWYENRMEVVVGTTTAQVPMASLDLLWPYKIKEF